MTPFAIAGIQMYVSATHSNVEGMKNRIDALMAVYPWVQMVTFSELAACGPLPSTAQALPGSAETALAEAAAKHKIWLVTGSMFERADDGLIYNTASVIDPTGTVVGRYRKMFVFEPYEQGITPGNEFFVFDVPEVGRFGMTICYDTWFPEVTRTLATMGAEVILRPDADVVDRPRRGVVDYARERRGQSVLSVRHQRARCRGLRPIDRMQPARPGTPSGRQQRGIHPAGNRLRHGTSIA